MIVLKYILITLGAFLVMEAITWTVHKYVMHGFLWYLHEDHHQPRYQNVFEKNDMFFVFGAIPSIILFYKGLIPELNHMFFLGLGMFLYGMCYFIVHDVLIHQRFSWFKNTNSWYFIGLRKAHKAHHKHLGKEDGECFGMLNVPYKYYKIAKGKK